MRRVLRRLFPPSPPPSGSDSLWHLLLATWPGRLLFAGLALKLLTAATGTSLSVLVTLDRLGAIALIAGGSYLAYQLFKLARRRLLWRVRRKLIISYVFIGVVPVLLVATFFVLCGLLVFFNISSYLVHARFDELVEQARTLAATTAVQLQRRGNESLQTVLLRRYATAQAQFPDASMALVPTRGEPRCGAGPDPAPGEPSAQTPIFIGPWTHVAPPRVAPRWVSCDGFSGLLVYQPPDTRDDGHLLVRALAFPDAPSPDFAVVIDVPGTQAIVERLRQETGILLGGVSIVNAGGEVPAQPLEGRTLGADDPAVPAASDEASSAPAVAIFDFVDWNRGRAGQLTLSMGVDIADMYSRLATAQGRNSAFGRFLVLLVAVVGGLFLVIEAVALLMGLALARSITGSVHELFEGTERVRRGDFSHKIAVAAHDQLGELADSFNSMTGSIEGFLREMDQKKRLEEELRIAREIQMSLLPQGPPALGGLSVAALCVPAREVGGDYYDFLPLDEHRTGVLIADVAGKGTSAALYMAELKGLVMALSSSSSSPRDLLIRANRFMSTTLDNRSFITMTYAVIDTAARQMRYARAGHTPLIHVPGPAEPGRRSRVLTPDGMVLGLRLDRTGRFDELLEEVTIPLVAGDLFVFFTDGISEAMNEQSDCFGETRLGALVEEHGGLPSEELRERILREIQAFVGSADQHDDMTMILLKVDQLPARGERSTTAAAGADLASAPQEA